MRKDPDPEWIRASLTPDLRRDTDPLPSSRLEKERGRLAPYQTRR
jgi:hypothetical protein